MSLLTMSVSDGEHAGGPCKIVSLAGQANGQGRAELEDVLVGEARKGRRIVVELSRLESLDQAALLVFVWASRVAGNAGGSLVLASPRPEVARALERSGIVTLLPVRVSVTEAAG